MDCLQRISNKLHIMLASITTLHWRDINSSHHITSKHRNLNGYRHGSGTNHRIQ